MLDWISVLIALLIAIVIYTVMAKKMRMFPFDGPVLPPSVGPVIPGGMKPDETAQANKMRSILLFVLIFVLLLIAIMMATMVKKKDKVVKAEMRYHCGM